MPWESQEKPEILLIDKQDRFLFSPLLYELVSEEMQSWEIAPPFAELLQDTQVNFQQGIVTGIDIPQKQVYLDFQAPISYDKLVIALGGQTPLDFVPGARDYAIPFRTLADAYRLKEALKTKLATHPEKVRIAVIGGGYSGVEVACKLADHLGEQSRVRIIEKTNTILAQSSEFNRQVAQNALEKRLIWLDLETSVEEIGSDYVRLKYKEKVDTIPVDIVVWTVGNQVSDLIKSLPLKHNSRGLVTTNNYLQSVDNSEVYILGDVADCHDVTGQQIPLTAQAAIQQADYCAWNLWASLKGKPLLPFRYQSLGEMLSLGVDNATLNGLGLKLDGPLAYVARRLIYLYRLPTLKHQLTVGLNWVSVPIFNFVSK
jgi:NADH dehydrogenase